MRYVIPIAKDTVIYNGNGLSGNTAKNCGKSEIIVIFKAITSLQSGSNLTSESSRALLKFDLSGYNGMVLSGSIPIGTSSVSFNLLMYNVQGNSASATASYISVYNVTSTWDDGNGVLNNESNGVANWVTSSYGTAWNNQGGDTGSLYADCYFSSGSEDGKWGINNLIQYWNDGNANHGVLAKLSSSAETDRISYGTKNFYSRETNTIYAPVIEVVWDDSIRDDTKYVVANTSMSSYYFNYGRTGLSNTTFTTASITTRVWSASVDPVYGTTLYIDTAPSFVRTGVYKTNFVIPYKTATVLVAWYSSSSDLGSIFYSQSINYDTGSMNGVYDPYGEYSATIVNMRSEYKYGEHAKLDIYARPKYTSTYQVYSTESVVPVRTILFNANYEISDSTTGEVIIPFSHYSKISYDSSKNWFEIWTEQFAKNRPYSIRLRYSIDGKTIIEDRNFKFTVI